MAIGIDSLSAFQQYWKKEEIPYIGLSDPTAIVPRLYKQEVNLFKLGRMPLNCVIDMQGKIRFIHRGTSMSDIPANSTLLEVIDHIK